VKIVKVIHVDQKSKHNVLPFGMGMDLDFIRRTEKFVGEKNQ
jgi:hypothetical protein